MVASGVNDTITVSPARAPPLVDGTIVAVAATDDPTAVHFFPKNAEDIWPLRQKDLIEQVNKRLSGGWTMTTHDMTCIKAKFDLFGAHAELACKPHRLASPQYSKALVDWIVDQYKMDNAFFRLVRDKYKVKK